MANIIARPFLRLNRFLEEPANDASSEFPIAFWKLLSAEAPQTPEAMPAPPTQRDNGDQVLPHPRPDPRIQELPTWEGPPPVQQIPEEFQPFAPGLPSPEESAYVANKVKTLNDLRADLARMEESKRNRPEDADAFDDEMDKVRAEIRKQEALLADRFQHLPPI